MYVYRMGQERHLVLYTYRNGIFQYMLEGGQAGRPVLLAEDYREGFSAAVHHLAIYYSYISRRGELCICCLGGKKEDWHISQTEGRKLYDPTLVSLRSGLMLFYITGEERYELQGDFAGGGEHTVCPRTFGSLPSFFCHAQGDRVLFDFSPLPDPFFCYSPVDGWEPLTASAGRELRKKDEVMESVKRQYNELMDTALRYREEAKKWHDLCVGGHMSRVPEGSVQTGNFNRISTVEKAGDGMLR